LNGPTATKSDVSTLPFPHSLHRDWLSGRPGCGGGVCGQEHHGQLPLARDRHRVASGLSAVCCLLSAACCLLSAVYRLLSAVCCLLSPACCLLSPACCWSSACLQNAVLSTLSFYPPDVCCPLFLLHPCTSSVSLVMSALLHTFH
jgi:hypothetical protein